MCAGPSLLQLQVGVEFEASTRMQDTSASFGYQLDLPKANFLFKGKEGLGFPPGNQARYDSAVSVVEAMGNRLKVCYGSGVGSFVHLQITQGGLAHSGAPALAHVVDVGVMLQTPSSCPRLVSSLAFPSHSCLTWASSIAMMKHHDGKQLGELRVDVGLQLRLPAYH